MTSLARFDNVQAEIFAQHDELQRLLRMSAALLGAAARGDGPCCQEVPLTLDTLAGKLHTHLDFEEAQLFPLLERLPGGARLVHLREEHARQRQELTRLGELAWKANELPALATAFDDIVRELRAEMAEEERWLAAQESTALEARASQVEGGPQGGSHIHQR